MKYFAVKHTSFRFAVIESIKTIPFKHEEDRDKYYNHMLESYSKDSNNVIEYESDGVSIYPNDDDWAYFIEKTTDTLKLVESINDDMSFNYMQFNFNLI